MKTFLILLPSFSGSLRQSVLTGTGRLEFDAENVNEDCYTDQKLSDFSNYPEDSKHYNNADNKKTTKSKKYFLNFKYKKKWKAMT